MTFAEGTVKAEKMPNGKWKVKYKLNDKKKSEKVPQTALQMEKQMEELAEEQLNLLEKNGKSKSQGSLGFSIQQMNAKEWLAEIGALGGNVWEKAKLPENYWNPADGKHGGSKIKMPPLFTGLADGGIDMVSDYPQLIKLGLDVVTKEEVRTGLWNGVKGISPSSIKEMAVGAAKEKWDKYANASTQVTSHEAGFDAVGMASALVGGKLLETIAETGKKIKKVANEVGELVGKYDWGLAKRYFKHIQEVTGRAVGQKQIDRLKDALRAKEFTKLSSAAVTTHRSKFTTSVKNKCITDWERETGQIWPKYTEVILDKNGDIYKKIGDPYDAHHIIENQFEGPHEWWNMHPAKFPDEHQGGIHASDSPSRDLFK